MNATLLAYVLSAYSLCVGMDGWMEMVQIQLLQ